MGHCTIYADSWSSVSKKVAEVDVTDGQTVDLTAELVNGDIDNDDAVTVFDYSILATLIDRGYSYTADLDGDGRITILDYSIMSDSFDQVGEDPEN